MKLNKKQIAAILAALAALIAVAQQFLATVPDELPDVELPAVVVPADAGL
jgi:hypothetical protein